MLLLTRRKGDRLSRERSQIMSEISLLSLPRRMSAFRLMDSYPQIQFYTSHCTGDAVFATLHQVMGDKIHVFSSGTINNDMANKNEI